MEIFWILDPELQQVLQDEDLFLLKQQQEQQQQQQQ
jgi:hypothetical protein